MSRAPEHRERIDRAGSREAYGNDRRGSERSERTAEGAIS
jgi:hypothetical protein